MIDSKSAMLELYNKLNALLPTGCGPFYAAIYDEEGNVVSETPNTVVNENCSHNHAEMNAIRWAEQKLKTYDLSKYSLHLYTTSEPCVMCVGGILWSGIKSVHYGVSTPAVEKATGFYEGPKQNWQAEFQKRGIEVEGPIEEAAGLKTFQIYKELGHLIYEPANQTQK